MPELSILPPQAAASSGLRDTTAALPVAASPGLRENTALKLWVVLNRAHAAITAKAQDDIKAAGLTVGEFAVLEMLLHKGPTLLGEVQRRVLVSSGGITFLVDRLERKGLVERQNCASDRRARYAVLTPRGEALIRHIFPGHARRLADAMSALTEEEQRLAADLLRKLGLSAAGAAVADRAP
jgi:MarR family 2-MHQ and catechol resistance regulon transcriptional repressor